MRPAIPLLAALALAAAGLAVAQEADAPAEGAATAEAPAELAPADAPAAREEHMKLYGAQLGVLGPMAQGQVPYDAAAAQAAADIIHENATSDDWAIMWPEGSAQGEVEGTRALPAIWENAEDLEAKHQALVDAATALKAAAGTDLAGLQAALGGVGQACGSCHEAYRGPDQ